MLLLLLWCRCCCCAAAYSYTIMLLLEGTRPCWLHDSTAAYSCTTVLLLQAQNTELALVADGLRIEVGRRLCLVCFHYMSWPKDSASALCAPLPSWRRNRFFLACVSLPSWLDSIPFLAVLLLRRSSAPASAAGCSLSAIGRRQTRPRPSLPGSSGRRRWSGRWRGCGRSWRVRPRR